MSEVESTPSPRHQIYARTIVMKQNLMISMLGSRNKAPLAFSRGTTRVIASNNQIIDASKIQCTMLLLVQPLKLQEPC